jgi:uncharacterized phage infection (PIP) family protein YhgE
MNTKNKKVSAEIDSVDQIRNILFGEQVKVIEKRFEQLESDLTSTINKLASKLDQNFEALQKQLDTTHKQLNQDTNELAQQQSESLKQLETSMNNKLVETESDLLNQIQSGLQNIDNKASHRNDLAKLLQEMADKLSD